MSTIRAVRDRRTKERTTKHTNILAEMLDDPNLSLQAKGYIGLSLVYGSKKNYRPTQEREYLQTVCICHGELKETQEEISDIINECVENGYAFWFHHTDENDKVIIELLVSSSKEEIEYFKKHFGKDEKNEVIE